MRKKCLFVAILLLGLQLVYTQPSWSAEPNEHNKPLSNTLKDLQQTIIEKIEHEADTTATAFADAENIDRDLRLKDIFRTPLVIIEETINTIGSLINAGKIAETTNQVLDSCETNLQIASTIMSISTLKQVGEDLQLAIDGPTYSSNIEKILDKAYRRSSTRLKFNPNAYKTVIKDYLYAQYAPGSLRIPRKSTDVPRRNLEIAPGTYEIERNIRQKFRTLRDKLEDNPLSPDSAAEAINQIQKIKRAIMASKGSNQKLTYQTYLKDKTGSYVPNTIDVRLGSIADLEKVRQIAFENLDKELMMQQITTISRATTAGIQATTLSLHTTYKSPKTGEILGEVQKWSLIPKIIEVGISKVFDTNAREQVNMIPQEMMMTLPLELSNVWMVADDTASYIEYLIETERQQPPKPTPLEKGIPAEIKLTDKSIIKGEILHEKIKIKTKYGEMNIPVEKFLSIIGQLIELKDGTTLKGNFAEKTLSVKTDYGKLKVQTKDIDFITFVKEEKPPVKEPLPPSEEKIPIPQYHGIYLVADGKLIPLKENTTLLGERLPDRQVLVGIETLSGVNVPGNVYIIIYDPLSASLVARGQLDRLFLFRLRYIDRDSPIQVLRWSGRETWADMWLAETGIRFKTTPVEDRNDMYCLIPVSTLPPGVYALLVIKSRIPAEVLAFDFKTKSEVALEGASLFSSPEKTIQTFFNAILNRNPNLVSRCMGKKLWNTLRSEISEEEQWWEYAEEQLQDCRITEKELINDSYALIKIESPKLSLWNLLKKHKERWEIVVWDESIESLPKFYKEIYQEPLPTQVTELLKKIETEKKPETEKRVKLGVVKGRAVDALSNDPVWKINIVVGGKSTIKYMSKTYRLTGIEPGSYTLKATAPNYYDFTKDIEVEKGENIVHIPMKGKEIPDLHGIVVWTESKERGIQLEIRFLNSKGEGITKFPCLSLDLEGKLYMRVGSEKNYTRGKELFSGPIELFWDSEAFLAKNKGIIPWEKVGQHLEIEKYGILDVVLHTPQGDFKDTVDDIKLCKE